MTNREAIAFATAWARKHAGRRWCDDVAGEMLLAYAMSMDRITSQTLMRVQMIEAARRYLGRTVRRWGRESELPEQARELSAASRQFVVDARDEADWVLSFATEAQARHLRQRYWHDSPGKTLSNYCSWARQAIRRRIGLPEHVQVCTRWVMRQPERRRFSRARSIA